MELILKAKDIRVEFKGRDVLDIEALELGNKKIDELRKEINNINIQMIKFSLLGETMTRISASSIIVLLPHSATEQLVFLSR